ncbi:cob(I)yrinic acid a,c-diamide adenosyltransferase [Pseudaeromonas sp. ZJS20]|uniref:cob(I)yrinic acid a,c-diamide adenosyltransferase n=1 Tax=Pseudaeromonas aegiceratis TaxID=3153928 RepID=UPI00390C784E
MSIYTKTGDRGTTALVGGNRVKKSDLRVDSYGTVDELNATLSLAHKAVQDADNRQFLEALQYQLFYLGAELASPEPAGVDRRQIGEADVAALEQAIDRCMAGVPPVHSFVLPGTSEAGSRLHLARTLARRAERRLVSLMEQVSIRPVVLQFLNRLSDCLYAMARHEDTQALTDTLVRTVVARYLAASQDAAQAEPSQPPAPANGPDFHLLHRLLQQAMAAAGQAGIPVVIAVVDRHGQPILTYRMPDALLVSLDLAPKKAYSAVALKCATHELARSSQPGAALFGLEASSGGKVVTFGGGYPLYWQGRLIGGLGISGGTVEQDMRIAEAAMHGLHLGKEA